MQEKGSIFKKMKEFKTPRFYEDLDAGMRKGEAKGD